MDTNPREFSKEQQRRRMLTLASKTHKTREKGSDAGRTWERSGAQRCEHPAIWTDSGACCPEMECGSSQIMFGKKQSSSFVSVQKAIGKPNGTRFGR